MSASDFTLYENGETREILHFYGDTQPASVAVLLDNSRSARTIWSELLLALRQFLAALRPNSEVAMLGFNDFVQTIVPFTPISPRNNERLFGAAVALTLDGRTALFDALREGIASLSHAANAKRAILLFGDGGDNASHVSEDDVMERLSSTAIVVHSVGISSTDNPDQNFGLLRKISRESGGYAGVVHDPRKLAEHFARVAEELSASYVLAFVPKPTGDAPSRIKVTLSAPEKSRLRVRHRELLASPKHLLPTHPLPDGAKGSLEGVAPK